MSTGRSHVRRALERARLDGPARRLRHAFDSGLSRRDRADQRNTTKILESTLTETSCCIDVGANVGDVLAEFVRLAPEGKHVAFEPLPALAAALTERFPTVTVQAAALSDEIGERSFVHVTTRPGWSGFRERPYPADEAVEHITVPVTRLDDALPDGYVPTLIKIDVEGAELEMLRGAEHTLRTHKPVLLFEHGAGSAEFYDTEPGDVFGLLTSLGYGIFGLDRSGPLSSADFTECFRTGSRVNFLARA